MADLRCSAPRTVRPAGAAIGVVVLFVPAEPFAPMIPADRVEQPAAERELAAQRRGVRDAAGPDQNGVVGRVLGPSQLALADPEVDVAAAEDLQVAARDLDQGREALYGEHFTGEAGEEGGDVARARADFQDAAVGGDAQASARGPAKMRAPRPILPGAGSVAKEFRPGSSRSLGLDTIPNSSDVPGWPQGLPGIQVRSLCFPGAARERYPDLNQAGIPVAR